MDSIGPHLGLSRTHRGCQADSRAWRPKWVLMSRPVRPSRAFRGRQDSWPLLDNSAQPQKEEMSGPEVLVSAESRMCRFGLQGLQGMWHSIPRLPASGLFGPRSQQPCPSMLRTSLWASSGLLRPLFCFKLLICMEPPFLWSGG